MSAGRPVSAWAAVASHSIRCLGCPGIRIDARIYAATIDGWRIRIVLPLGVAQRID